MLSVVVPLVFSGFSICADFSRIERIQIHFTVISGICSFISGSGGIISVSGNIISLSFWIRSVKNRSNFLAIMAFLQKLLFFQKYLCQIWSGFLASKRFFFFKWICVLLLNRSIERFGSTWMAESLLSLFQACSFKVFTSNFYQCQITQLFN